MTRRIIIALALLAAAVWPLAARRTITLEECVTAAEANYPLVRKYVPIERVAELNLSDINRSWLPGVTVYGQGTVQNVVPSFPVPLTDMLAQMGQDFRGLGKLQYKVGVDLSQTIWDGGQSKSSRKVERLSAEARRAAVDVDMYALRGRVEDLYFGILLLDEQIAQATLTRGLLAANLDKLRAMLACGTAMQADVDMVEAQMLVTDQQITAAGSSVKACRASLALFTGLDMQDSELERPEAQMPPTLESARPELGLFDARLKLSQARQGAVRSSVMPRVGLFAQAYYGYPGIDYFRSMRSRDMTFNVLAGVKVSWSLSPLYTRKNRLASLAADAAQTEADRDVFLFNSRMLSDSQLEAVEGLRRVMADDSRIVSLRRSVRMAAEAQLDNGIIDASALLAKITDENMAELTARYHEIELLKTICQLRTTLNR